MPDFFFTQSCNHTTCKGLRHLRDWMSSDEAVATVMRKFDLQHAQAKHHLRTSALSCVHRTWNAISNLWLKCICESNEQPLGPILWCWHRKEFQDVAGDCNHIHATLKSKLNANGVSDRQILLEKIRGSLSDLIHCDEGLELQKRGIIASSECLRDLL